MSASWFYNFLADVVLFVHFAIVLFVVAGLIFILVGNRFAWSWANSVAFRIAHLACILIVVVQSWFGITCPLTSLESWLRKMAGSTVYKTSFVEYWVHRLLFFDAPSWVFALAYTLFGILVVLAWWFFPPRFSKARKEPGA